MKKIIILGLLGIISQQLLAQVPKTLIGKTFHNSARWNMDARHGGVPSIRFESANIASVKKGDVVEEAKVKKYRKGFIITTTYRKISDTLQFDVFPDSKVKKANYEMTDQNGQIWTTSFSSTTESKVLKDFPAATRGYKRSIINLPPQKNEEDWKVEIYAGIMQEVDCNSYQMLGEFQEENLEGFGYTYYKVETEERTIGTLKACLDGKKTTKYIYMFPKMVNYNSKMPIVIYAPEHVQIRYKVYNTKGVWQYAVGQ